MDGDTATAFARCAAEAGAAIRRQPAHWLYWPSAADLARLGLLLPADEAGEPVPVERPEAPAAEPALPAATQRTHP